MKITKVLKMNFYLEIKYVLKVFEVLGNNFEYSSLNTVFKILPKSDYK